MKILVLLAVLFLTTFLACMWLKCTLEKSQIGDRRSEIGRQIEEVER